MDHREFESTTLMNHSGPDSIDWNFFHLRSRILKSIRSFFDHEGFLEIEAPILIPYPTLDANIASMRTHVQFRGSRKPFFLHTSPESTMKQLLAMGAEKIFFIGKVFRNDELTHLHNPEFTMLEWYRCHADYRKIQEDTERLICWIRDENPDHFQQVKSGGKCIDLSPPWDRIGLKDLFMEKTGVDLESDDRLETLRQAAAANGLRDVRNTDWETLFFRLFLELIEPGIGFPKPLFIVDYPLRLGLMARQKPGNPKWVERVELYVAGLELANGYSELLDAEEQERRMEAEIRKRKMSGQQNLKKDTDLLSALKRGIPPASGIAMGVDRLVMLLTGKSNIQDVILFPHARWLQDDEKDR